MPKVMLTPEEERKNLAHSVALANDHREWADLYDEDGPKSGVYHPETPVQFRRMLRALQAWDASGSRNILDLKLAPEDRADLRKYTAEITVGVQPNGTYYVRDFYPPSGNQAVLQFQRLLNNSQRGYLQGPCGNRKRHDDHDYWYLTKTKHRSEFCSTRCSGDARQARKRENDYKRKIAKAEAAIKNYSTRHARYSKLTWQEYVIKAEPSISKKFLTVAVKDGRLTPPKDLTGAGF
jgi:hypothetical protein